MPENQTPHTPGSGADYARRMRTERAKEMSRQEPSLGAMIAKIIFGLGCIAIGIFVKSDSGSPIIGLLIAGIIIGVALIAWGILGYKQQQKRIEDAKVEVILSEPMQTYGNQELNDLAAKYDQAEGKTDGKQ